MNPRVVTAALAAAASLLVSIGAGCTSRDDGASSDGAAETTTRQTGQALRQVELPDLAPMMPSVREQIRQRHSLLISKQDNPATPAAELADAYGEMGKLLMAAKYQELAESCFLNAQMLVPTDRRWPYYLGHLYQSMGALAESVASFEQALRLRTDDVPTLISLGEVHLAQGQPDAAERLFAEALTLQPGSVSARYGLGRAALARKDYVRAVNHLEQALSLDPSAGGIHYPLAMAYRGLGDATKADVHFRQVSDVAILPADPLMQELEDILATPLVYESRGTLALQGGEYAEAAAYFRKGVELAPDQPSLRHRLGTALFMMGNAREATEQFEHALRLSPRFARAHYSLGLIMEANGRVRDAIERLSAAVRYDPNYVEARLKLAAILRRTGRAQESLAQYVQVMKIAQEVGGDPRAAEAPFGYALGLVQLRRFQEARDWLAQGVTASGGQPVYVHALARLLSAASDNRVRDGRRAMTLMEGLPDEQRRMDGGETMAMTLAELGQYGQAVAWQKEALASATRDGRGDVARRMTEKLRVYERGRPWRSDDPIEFDGPPN